MVEPAAVRHGADRLPATAATRLLAVEHPVVLAPTGGLATPALARAVSEAGGLGLLGVGYGEEIDLRRALDATRDARVGCGFLGWLLHHRPGLLDLVLDRDPAAVMLSFGPLAPFAARVRDRGVPLLCRVSTLAEADEALGEGADVLVAHGAEAGGHGVQRRSTLTLVPEVCDLAARRGRAVPVLASGGVADGRGLAAVLALGAAGAVVGTRFWASHESPVPSGVHDRAVRATGDDTLVTTVCDRACGVTWPPGHASRILRSPFAARWHGHESELDWELALVSRRYQHGVRTADADVVAVEVGEGVGMVHTVEPVERILRTMVEGAAGVLAGLGGS